MPGENIQNSGENIKAGLEAKKDLNDSKQAETDRVREMAATPKDIDDKPLPLSESIFDIFDEPILAYKKTGKEYQIDSESPLHNRLFKAFDITSGQGLPEKNRPTLATQCGFKLGKDHEKLLLEIEYKIPGHKEVITAVMQLAEEKYDNINFSTTVTFKRPFDKTTDIITDEDRAQIVANPLYLELHPPQQKKKPDPIAAN